jgi:hypothetical protein
MSEKFLVKQMEGHQTVQGAQVQACSPTGQVGDVVRFFLSATISAGFVKGALTCFSYLLHLNCSIGRTLIGVIPIIGLNGFMLGRSTPILNTKKMKQHSHLPVNIQLYNGKYPGSKCKLTSYKPSTYGISELLSDQPDYLGALGNGNNLVEEESSPMETAEDISVPGEDFQKIPFWTTLSAGSSHHLRFYARTSTSLSFPDLSASLHSSAPNVNFEASGVKPTSADMRMIINMGGSAFHSTTSSIIRNPVSMLVHGIEPSENLLLGKGMALVMVLESPSVIS